MFNMNSLPPWAKVLVMALAMVPMLSGARYMGAWPFGADAPAVAEKPVLVFATAGELSDVAARVTRLADTSASKATVEELRAELSRLQKAITALSTRKGSRVTTGSVK